MTAAKTVPGAFSACAGRLCDGNWYGGVLLLRGRDDEFLLTPLGATYEQRAAHARNWAELTVSPSREIALVTPGKGDGPHPRCIAAAERLEGPVAPAEAVQTPTLAWIERRQGQVHLALFQDAAVKTVFSSNRILRAPRIANSAMGVLFAVESDAGPNCTVVTVVDKNGLVLYETVGRNPVLRAAGEGVVICTEQVTPDEVFLRAECFTAGDWSEPAQAVDLREGEMLLNADIAWSDAESSLFIAAERSPCLGYSCQIGLHRTIPVWRWTPGDEPVSLAPLPVEKRAFKSIGVENMAPIKPSVVIEDGMPVVLFKQHRFTGFRAFGWDLFWCRYHGEAWTEPARISPATMTSDSNFGLVPRGRTYVGLFPAHQNQGGSGSKHSEDHRVDLLTIAPDTRLDRFEVPDDKKADYRMPPACRDVAPEPPPLESPYEGRQLVWGDLHIHTVYSKCVAAVDGGPRENVRFVRDVLGGRVFAFAEHTQYTTGIESTWLYDRLESTAGEDNVVLYATEPGIHATRHMNWYCRDRETFEKLERILISQDRRYPDVLRQVREDLPSDSVFVMRHVHGDAIADAQIPQHFDPRFEVAMEAMQGRGNAMLGAVEGSAIFPNAFLDAGCKIGLVGGTDHFREWAPNHFCLTGFWVKEVSAAGVWEAIRNRFTLAMSDSRVAMLTRCKGVPMGGMVSLAADEPMVVTVQAGCGHRIRRMTLIRDGDILPWTDVGANVATVDLTDEPMSPGRHWVVPTIEVDTGHGADNTGICHASPYFVWKNES